MKSENKSEIQLYRKPYHPAEGDEIENIVYRSFHKYLVTYFNAKANEIEFKPFNRQMNHWVSSQGDDILFKKDSTKILDRGRRTIQVLKHTKPIANIFGKKSSGIDRRDKAKPSNRYGSDKNIQHLVINPIEYRGIKLSRPRILALFFVENENNYNFVSVADGDVFNLSASNLYWSDKNLYPQLNVSYEVEDVTHDVVIHTPAIRALSETMKHHSWERSYTPVTVPIPKDLMIFYKQWGIAIPSAVYSSLRFLAQWSFCVYAIEYREGSKVFVGMTPALDGIYNDQIYKVTGELPILKEIMESEGRGVLEIKYLTMSQTRREAVINCTDFLNRYHNKGWEIINNDFYLDNMEREINLKISLSDLEAINVKLKEKKGTTLEKYLKAVIRNLKDS